MWEARAEYSDGSTIDRFFDGTGTEEEQYNLECWLIEQEKECTWYSVNWIFDDEEA